MNLVQKFKKENGSISPFSKKGMTWLQKERYKLKIFRLKNDSFVIMKKLPSNTTFSLNIYKDKAYVIVTQYKDGIKSRVEIKFDGKEFSKIISFFLNTWC